MTADQRAGKLTSSQRDRAVGVLVAMAAGDALRAGNQADPLVSAEYPVTIIDGDLGPFALGEWTGDTATAIAIAEIASTGGDLRSEASLNRLVQRWYECSPTTKDVGDQTATVLSAAGRQGISAVTARERMLVQDDRTGRTAGSVLLMLAAPVALAYLGDAADLPAAARAISELIHFDPEAGDACALWCTAIRHAVLTGELDIRTGLAHLDVDRHKVWAARLDEAETSLPSDLSAADGSVVATLQAAWCAITTTRLPVDDPAAGIFRADHLRLAFEAAVLGGGDIDNIAAVAGGLLGAVWGASAVPWQWRTGLHGWPGLETRGLVRLAEMIVNKGQIDRVDPTYGAVGAPPKPTRHPHDDQVWIGAAGCLHTLPPGVDAVVSLCRVADGHIPAGITHLDVRLIDQENANPNLDFVLLDTVRAIEGLRADGHTVFVHCLFAISRTPTIAALYGARRAGIDIDRALDEVIAVLPDADPNPDFLAALHRLHPNSSRQGKEAPWA